MVERLLWKEDEGYDIHVLRGGPASKALDSALVLDITSGVGQNAVSSGWAATEDRVRLLSEPAGQLQSARQSACLAVPAYRRCNSCSRSDRSKRLVPSGWSASS